MQQILNNTEVATTFPRTVRLTLGYPILRWSYEKTIGSKLITDKQTLHDFKFDDDSSDPEHGCRLLKTTSRNYSLLEVSRGASNLRAIFRNYLEAFFFVSAVAGEFLIKNHENRQLKRFFDFCAKL